MKKDERVFHIPTRKYGTVRCVARDGSWVEVCFDGTKHGRRVPQAELRPLIRRAAIYSSKEGDSLITEIDRISFYNKSNLCDTCRYATAVDCPYLGLKDLEKGIAKTGCYTVMTHLLNGSVIYKVEQCKKYEKGDLPPIGWPEKVVDTKVLGRGERSG